MLAHLKTHHATMCRQWFHELEPLGTFGGVLELRAATQLHRDYLRRACNDAFNDAARVASGHLLSVRFLGPSDVSTKEATSRDGMAGGGGHPSPDGQRPPDGRPSVRSALASGKRGEPVDVDALDGPGVEASLPTEPVFSLPVQVGQHNTPPTGDASAPPPSSASLPRPAGTGTSRIVVTPSEPTRYESLEVNPDNSFDHFVVGPHNRLAHAAAMAVANQPGRTYNPFFVHGGVGLGKTHLLQAVCLRINALHPSLRLYYTSCEGFVSQFLECVQNGRMAEFRQRFRGVDVLIIDDIHFLTKRDRSQEEFFHTFNSLFQQQRQIILSSDAAPDEIPALEDRLVSRFTWGLVAKIGSPDFETRIEILKTKARLRGLSLPDDVAHFLAERLTHNVRELEGIVVQLHLRSLVEKPPAPITLDLARAALGEKPLANFDEPTIQTVIGVVVDFYNIRLADLQSKDRHRSIALPRHVCMHLARHCTRLSLEEIGGFFGGRDHTTVLHALKTVKTKLETEPSFRDTLSLLEQRVRQPRAGGGTNLPTLPPANHPPTDTNSL